MRCNNQIRYEFLHCTLEIKLFLKNRDLSASDNTLWISMLNKDNSNEMEQHDKLRDAVQSDEPLTGKQLAPLIIFSLKFINQSTLI